MTAPAPHPARLVASVLALAVVGLCAWGAVEAVMDAYAQAHEVCAVQCGLDVSFEASPAGCRCLP